MDYVPSWVGLTFFVVGVVWFVGMTLMVVVISYKMFFGKEEKKARKEVMNGEVDLSDGKAHYF